jgi:hypothetical protein
MLSVHVTSRTIRCAVRIAAVLLCPLPCLAQIANQSTGQGVMAPAPQPAPVLPADTRSIPPSPALPDALPQPPQSNVGRLDSLPPHVRAWARLRGQGLARGGPIPSAEDMPGHVRQAAGGLLGDMNSADIEAVAFLVLMEATKSAREDLKSIMGKVKEINEAKDRLGKSREALRAAASAQGKTAPCAVADCGAARRDLAHAQALLGGKSAHVIPPSPNKAGALKAAERMKKTLDALSEMGALDNLRLQEAMEKKSAFESLLSNMLKTYQQTGRAIIQNLK